MAGIKPKTWREQDRLREQRNRLIRQGLGAKVNPRHLLGSVKPKMESGAVWICSECNIMNERLRCKNCGRPRFGGLFNSDLRVAEQQFRDMLHRRRA